MKTANDGMHSALYWPARVAALEEGLREAVRIADDLDTCGDHGSTCQLRLRGGQSADACDCGWHGASTSFTEWLQRVSALLGDKGTRE